MAYISYNKGSERKKSGCSEIARKFILGSVSWNCSALSECFPIPNLFLHVDLVEGPGNMSLVPGLTEEHVFGVQVRVLRRFHMTYLCSMMKTSTEHVFGTQA